MPPYVFPVFLSFVTVPLTPSQAEYANILHKRVAEAKSQQQEMKKRRASSMRK
jgi:hypothetical protein